MDRGEREGMRVDQGGGESGWWGAENGWLGGRENFKERFTEDGENGGRGVPHRLSLSLSAL